MKILYTFILCVLATHLAFAHPFGNVKGVVLNDQTNEPIAAVTVILDNFKIQPMQTARLKLAKFRLGNTKSVSKKKALKQKQDPSVFLEIKHLKCVFY